MSTSADSNQSVATRALLEHELLMSQRAIVGRIDSIGIICVAILVPVGLWDVSNQPRLVLWSTLIVLTTLGWTDRLPWSRGRAEQLAVWLSGVVWAILPWLLISSLDTPYVAWVLVAVCGYGLATDALLLPQTFRVQVYPLMFSYWLSYVAAFLISQHWLAATSITLLSIHLAAGIWGFERIKRALVAKQAEVEVEAYRDQLTGLGSRGAAIREIERRLGIGESVHLIVADVDDFKAINTHLGHHGGDAALQALAIALQARLKGWYIARLGGDEFVAVHRRGLHPSEEGLLTAIDVGEVGPGHGPQILSLSMGASSTDGSASPDQLLMEASAALQQAKRLGKQRLVVADDELREQETHRQTLAALAHTALVDNDIIAWGQPIFDLSSGKIAGIELLARWPRPDGTIEMPSDFVPVIEAHGLGSMLGKAMISHGTQALRDITALGDTTTFVSVNLSALALLELELAQRIADDLGAAGITPSRFVVEMTESQRLPNSELAQQAFDRLRAAGIGIASDDLGAGWSSINQMIEAPFTHIKVDRTLINALNRRGAGDLIASIRTLAEGNGQIAVAEGIETATELTQVRMANFGLGQGYLLARPAPIAGLIDEFVQSATIPAALDVAPDTKPETLIEDPRLTAER